MKTKIVLILLLVNLTSKAQQAIAFTNFTANVNLSDKNIYLFVAPQPFKYTKGSNYVFVPIELKQKVEATIEKILKNWDSEWSGLYVKKIPKLF